ncbi:hypothetical protein ABFS83_05G068100 [Erythranthe nasuta]
MMVSYSGKEAESFVDRNNVSTVSDSCLDPPEYSFSSGPDKFALDYEFWTEEPDSVDERRDKFLKWMGLTSNWHEEDESPREDLKRDDFDRLRVLEEDPLVNFDSEESEFFSTCSFQSFRSHDSTNFLEDCSKFDENLMWKIKNLDNGTEYELAEEGCCTMLHELGSNKMISLDEFHKTLGSSSLVQHLLRKDCKGFNIVNPKKTKANWLHRFSPVSHIIDRTKGLLRKTEIYPKTGLTNQRIRVNVYKKHTKELSSVYTGQEFHAHDGSILTMKFSHDGLYLASAGVDGVVRVWKVLEEEDVVNKLNKQDVLDPSSVYFSLSHSSKLTPLEFAKEKDDHMKFLKKSSESSCVILPPKAFQLSEKPLHEFHGHSGEVLSLSWSKNGYLLSSSVDKTARLWRVGNDGCLGVYQHNNYVTCVEFNPVDDNNFISGSIDGKLRIWEVEGGRVIDWIDIREIVTAVCYRPDGKGGIVGSMDGSCRFYDIIDNRVELGASVCLKGKKKSPGNRIIGFQYCPSDVSKVMVTCADSQVQILCGTNILCKFKGNRGTVSQVPAAFTSDGEHIISATDESNVRVWNYASTPPDQKPSRLKTVFSRETFFSQNSSIAIPWCGLKNKLGSLPASILGNSHFDEKLLQKFPDCLTTSLGFFLDALYRGSATWPEERLPPVKPSVTKSEFKFLKNSWLSAFNSPHLWGLVVVTAGWDGCIRTFLNYGLPIRF